MKQCGSCKLLKEFSEFHRRGNGYQSVCKDCRRLFDKKWTSDPKRKEQIAKYKLEVVNYFAEIKATNPCTDCGKIYLPCQMAWDHLPQYPKMANLADLIKNGAKKAALEEIKKCELVCHNCHALRTYKRGKAVSGSAPGLGPGYLGGSNPSASI